MRMSNVLSVFSVGMILFLSTPAIAEQSPIEISFKIPSETTIQKINSGQFNLILKIHNTSNDQVILWPYFSSYMLDANAKLQKRSRNEKRWAQLDQPSVLESVKFITLGGDDEMQLKVRIDQFDHDPDALIGWKIENEGEYQLVLRYHYNREAMKRKYGKGCKRIDDKDKDWNRATETDQTVKVLFTVN